jgi:hypothetical protein
VLFENEGYTGRRYDNTLGFGGCDDVFGFENFNDMTSSAFVFKGTCIRLWEHGSCTGRYLEVRGPGAGNSNLSQANFNDLTSSVGTC